jgi:hypothetical protein
MKKTGIFILGILLGTIFISGHLYSHSEVFPDQDPAVVGQSVSKVKVFPNPSDGRFQLSFDYSGKEKVTAKVYDLTGKLHKNITADLLSGATAVTATVDLENPSSGIYFIRIEWGSRMLTKKIIIR